MILYVIENDNRNKIIINLHKQIERLKNGNSPLTTQKYLSTNHTKVSNGLEIKLYIVDMHVVSKLINNQAEIISIIGKKCHR